MYVCFLRLYKKLYYSNFRIFFVKAKLHAMANFTFSFFETLIQELVTHCHYYRKRGSASYIVREVHSVRERERERDTE